MRRFAKPQTRIFTSFLVFTVLSGNGFQSLAREEHACVTGYGQGTAAVSAQHVEAKTTERPPESPERTPIIEVDRAKTVIQSTSKLGDYSLVEIALGSGATLKIVVDSKADWLLRAVEAHAQKPAAQLEQKSIKAFLESLAMTDLSKILTPRERVFRAETRKIVRDGATYYLEELVSSGERKDLAIALIGQILFEGFVKKETRIVQVTPEGSRQPNFGLLVMNGNPEVLVPGKCMNAGCGPNARVVGAELKVASSPAVITKQESRFSVVDYKGKSHDIQVLGRSATERMLKHDKEQYDNAGPDDIVPVEFFIMTAYFPTGTTMFRIGDSMMQFGFEGWDAGEGSEGAKGYLFGNPYQKYMFQTFAGFNLPPFNVGETILMPKRIAEAVKKQVAYEMALPAEQKKPFNLYSNNCVHNVLRVFRMAGADLGTAGSFTSHSSSLIFRELFFNSKNPVQSVRAYLFPGTEIAADKLRSLFPQFIYRGYSVKADKPLLTVNESKREAYKDSVMLAAIAAKGSGGMEAVTPVLEKTIGVDRISERIEAAYRAGLIKRDTLELTEAGRKVLAERAIEYDLSIAR